MCPHDHNALKSDPAKWAALPLVGIQRLDADGDEPAYRLVLKNCTACHSTLAVEIKETP
jgi:hypothetical protein